MDHKYDYADIEQKRSLNWSWGDIATQYLGTTSKQVRQAYHRWKQRGRGGADQPPPEESRGNEVRAEYKPASGTLGGKSREPLTLEQLMEMSDLRPEDWEVLWCRPGYSEQGSKGPDGAVHVERLFNLQARLRPQLSTSVLEEVKAQLVEEVREASEITSRPFYKENPPQDPRMAESAMMDIHYGMLAWRHETGEDFDLHIVTDLHRTAVDSAMDEAAGYPIDHFLIPLGNDFFHTDSTVAGKGGQTHAGTPQDVDGRWQKAFNMGKESMIWTIRRFLEIAPVKIVVVPGNHDRTKTWFLGEVLSAFFHDDPNVEVDNRPVLRKYHAYGNSLLGFTHGDEEKPADLPIIMANEARGFWDRSRFREWHMGHWHHDWVKERKGVKCQFFPALVGTDAWHHQKGYAGNHRETQLIMWSLDRGRTATFHHTVQPLPEHVVDLGPALEYVGTPVV